MIILTSCSLTVASCGIKLARDTKLAQRFDPAGEHRCPRGDEVLVLHIHCRRAEYGLCGSSTQQCIYPDGCNGRGIVLADFGGPAFDPVGDFRGEAVDEGSVCVVEPWRLAWWCARRDLKELGFLVEHCEDVAAEHGQFDAQVAEAGEQRTDVMHGATAVELPVDARLKECLFGFEVVIKRARPWRQAGGGFDLG